MGVSVERLHPSSSPTTLELPVALAGLDLPGRAGAGRPFTYLNMVASLDGRAALDGGTRGLGGAADVACLVELRTLADALLVGTRTLRGEGYGRLVRAPGRRARRVAAGQAADLLAVVVSRSGHVPWEAELFAQAGQPVLVYGPGATTAPEGCAAAVEVVRMPDPAPSAVLADLRARGVRALLCEGGPTLARGLVAAGLLDELFLTLAPVLTGDETAPAILAGGRLDLPARLRLEWVLRHGDELLLRYAVAQ